MAKHQKKYLFKNKETSFQQLSTGNIARSTHFEPPLSWDKQRKKKNLADMTIFQTLTTIFTALRAVTLTNRAEKRWKGWGAFYSPVTFSASLHLRLFRGVTPRGVRSNTQEASNFTPT